MKFLDAAVLPEMSFPGENGIIEAGILPVSGRMVIAGPPKIGKSLLALDMGQALVNKTEWLGNEINKRCGVLIIQAELHARSLKSRIKNMNIKTPLGALLISPPTRSLNLRHRQGMDQVREWLDKHEPDAVFFDPLVSFFAGDENRVIDMMDFLTKIDKVVEDRAVILIHHTKKPDQNSKTGRDMLRGSSALAGWADSLIILDGDGQGRVRMKFILRDGEPLPDLRLKLETNPLRFKEIEKDNFVADWSTLFNGAGAINSAALRRAIQQTHGVSESTAKRYINEGKVTGKIDSRKDGKNVLFFVKGSQGELNA